jgi:kynurenine formamidase
MKTLSNWGRWGADDVKGTVNFIDRAARLRAAAQIVEGESVSTSREISSTPEPDQTFGPPLHLLLAEPFDVNTGEGRIYDYFGLPSHGYDLSHIDALRHNHFEGEMYGGRPKTSGHPAPEDPFDMRALRDGVFTRGILLDLPRHFGVEWMGDRGPATPAELDRYLASIGVTLEPGDAILMRSGYDDRRNRLGVPAPGLQPGWHASTLPWVHEHRIALTGADTFCDYRPSGYDFRTPFHTVGIVAMGLSLVDNLDLTRLADRCAELGRWTFALSIAPLPLRGGTGCPVNPIAIF